MPQEQLPLLIFAQTARFIAQSASQLGYETWVADCFADTDTQRVADRLLQLPPLDELSTDYLLSSLQTLSQQQTCILICGAGIERFYPVLKQLPAHIQLLGNTFQTFQQLRSPRHFYPLLNKLTIPYPETLFSSPVDNHKNWLKKDMKGCGGIHINAADHHLDNHVIFQKNIEGKSASASFIADGHSLSILGFNTQVHDKHTFKLQQLINRIELEASSKEKVAGALEKLIKITGYKGFGSLDFLVDDTDNIYILELNPRLSASAELYSESGDILRWHIQACMGLLPDPRCYKHTHTKKLRCLSYFFADKNYHVRARGNWPNEAHDIPSPSQTIYSGQPICTLIIEAEDEQACAHKRHQLETEIRKNCLYSA